MTSRTLIHPRSHYLQVGSAVALALAALLSTVSRVTAEHPRESDTREFENVPSNMRKVPANVPLGASELNVPPFTPSNVNVSNLVGNEAEVSIATNPTDPLNMVVVGHGPAFTTMSAFSTTDGGETWTLVSFGAAQDGLASCVRADPTVAYDANGVVYIGYFTFQCASGTRTLIVARSNDGGQTYPQITSAVVDPTDLLDKEIIGTGPDPGDPTQQNVYIAYRLDVGSDVQLHVTASYDGGATFPSDEIINDDSIGGDDFASFGMPAVGPNGELYVVWDDFSDKPDFSRIMVDVSLDGGATWDTDVEIGTTEVTRDNANGLPPSGRYTIPAQPDRGILAVPSIAVDVTGGANDGRVYVAYTVVGDGGDFDTDIITRFSDDEAATWSAPVTVNDDGGDTSQFLPWLSVDNCGDGDGRVAVVWYDARNDDPDNEKVQTFMGVSENGAVSYKANIQVASGQSDQSASNDGAWSNNFLEYIGVASCNNMACAVWADNSTDLDDLDFFSDCVPLVNFPPIADAGPDQTLECTGPTTPVTLDGTGSEDPNGDLLTFLWSAPGIVFDDPTSPTPTGAFPVGVTTVTLVVSDGEFEDSDEVVITILDTTPPTITVELNRDVLWPPNHKLVDIIATVTVEDLCDEDASFVLTSITSDELDEGLGDGDHPNDIQGAVIGTPDVEFQLRSERSGLGDGRVYTIVYTASDASGNTAEFTVEVHVPHHQRGLANGATGFDAMGTGFLPGAERFALVLLSVPEEDLGTGFDAALVEPSRTYVGNTAGAARPLESWVGDVDNDGLADRVCFYSVAVAQQIAAASEVLDGPVGFAYEDGVGRAFLVSDIFQLGPPIALGSQTGLADLPPSAAPRVTALSRIYPNPLNPSTTVAFDLAEDREVRIEVYDAGGALVRTLLRAARPAGHHEMRWDGRNNAGRMLGSGVYTIRLVAGNSRSAQKVVILK
jgi:hypothetical protein